MERESEIQIAMTRGLQPPETPALASKAINIYKYLHSHAHIHVHTHKHTDTQLNLRKNKTFDYIKIICIDTYIKNTYS